MIGVWRNLTVICNSTVGAVPALADMGLPLAAANLIFYTLYCHVTIITFIWSCAYCTFPYTRHPERPYWLRTMDRRGMAYLGVNRRHVARWTLRAIWR